MKYKGFGRGVIERLVKTSIKRNLYYEIKERVIEESFNGYRVNKNKQLVRIYGIDSTREVRARLIEILYERVAYHKDKFIAKILHDEMEAMEVKSSGKVEHSDTTHDDQVFSYLMAMYVWYDGHNIMENFNIQKNTIKTDEDVELVDDELEASKNNTTKIPLDTDEIRDVVQDFDSTEKYIKDAAKYKTNTDYNETVYNSEQQQLAMALGTDKLFVEGYNKLYHTDNSTTTNGPVAVVNLPDTAYDIEICDDEDNMMQQQAYLHGNLWGGYKNL